MQRRSAHEGIQGRILEMAQRRRIACEQVIERYLFGQAPGSTLAWLTRKPDGDDQCTQADLIAFAQLNDAAGSQGSSAPLIHVIPARSRRQNAPSREKSSA